MATELAKAYDPKAVEEETYRRWERSGFFNPDKLPGKRGKPFTIIMPPPNANGALHIGHAVFVTLQDIMIRFWRMRGRKALWLPGADHAGIATEYQYRKILAKEKKRWEDIPRDELYQQIFEFTLANKTVMESQLRKLGASCDWSREKFTLDPDVIRTAQDTFVQMYEDKLIYRGTRIINWSVKDQTALSDLEMKYVECIDPLYYIKYGPLEVATVRPETKFGDTAVAVNPRDTRYRKYVGKEIEIETLIGPANIRVIADEAVDPNFGTGVVKVTPAHDPVDFEIGLRHNLEVREVIDRSGRLNEKTGPYQGLTVGEARKRVAEDMQAKGLVVKIEENYKHTVAVDERTGAIVEPMVMPQWFVKMKPLAEKAIRAVEKGEIKIIPERYKKVYFHWLKNIRDWNISRQIVWGIRIPAWYCVGCGATRIRPNIRGNWYFVRHGETDWNREGRTQGHTDIPLNERGREQARAVARGLRDRGIDLVISSDLARAAETAEIIARKIGVEVFHDQNLRERNFGSWEGRTRDEIGAEAIQRFRETQEGPDSVELFEDLEKRVGAALEAHGRAHRHKNVVIVAHGGVLRVVLKKFRKISNFKEVALHNASVMHFAVSDDCAKCGGDFVEQDSDVLDTWFSSGQWPYATLMASRSNQQPATSNQPTKAKNQKLKTDFSTYYPTDVMETGYDILFFWVARMIMLGLYRTGKVPFRTVYLHGLVRDKDRQKMSKSKGNVIDPLGVAELYGTDAVRMALVVGNLPGQDIIISEEKIRGYRNFANKLWNIHRFVMLKAAPSRGSGQTNAAKATKAAKVPYSAEDRKLLRELKALVKRVTSDLERFRFHHAAEALYHYVWHTFADKVIEAQKPRLASNDPGERAAASALLLEVHSTLLKLLHPFMPFITEELWANLPGKRGLLLVEPWPRTYDY